MSNDKIFRVDYYPSQAFIDFSRMEADEIAVIIQVSNLIYMNQGPIENDAKWIAGTIKKMGGARCRNLVNNLVEKGELQITPDGKLTKKRCENELKTVTKRRENSVNQGKIGAEKRWSNEQNQELNLSPPINSEIARTNTSTRTNTNSPNSNTESRPARAEGVGVFKNGEGEKENSPRPQTTVPVPSSPPSPPSKTTYSVEHKLTDAGIKLAKSNAPGWDIYHLMRVYDQGINNGNREPPRNPDRAFAAWCALYTKGKQP